MKTELLTIEPARELLKAAMETQGRQFVYNPEGGSYICENAPMEVGRVLTSYAADEPDIILAEGNPRTITGCLIGTALTLAGYTHHLGHGLQGGGVSDVGHFINEKGEKVRVLDDFVVRYFAVAQRRQDTGGTWGQAYDDAEAYYRRQKTLDQLDGVG